ncbi:MAG TPA: 3-methyl-2-oxobutanoate hydroxymethyltransferase [Piscinibacter sp.]|jgi:3-methyl-2-oxobutanoate hydroxymethyltransferase|uniref:3-methyl-2-oxobutanoate hydroxymethyltransferase n=1 Tax=Piscinibacter sp. TaxID=1903157 RepID=UPI002600DE11|nr:3-methyl-2-oxobutanoate hydroxymethyltransferase [Piscinibacter sp.]HPG79869.1 3-methyl-2-oxobutanoate hydroxymethyltransferase [Piscinibacter sp.]HPM67332.1 3-methyl-2-oxobutanoate hydroxymethyltransferase [Piscinibacter sp.]
MYPTPSNPGDGTAAARKAMTLHRLAAMRAAGEKITMLTCYDASFARLLDDAGVDVLLIGDSLGMTLQGRDSTLPVTLDEMAYHVQCVARGNRHAWIVGDLPFGSYHTGTEQALLSAARLMQSGAHMVKLEGGGWTVPVVRHLVERGIPVCAHLGLTPQSVHALGGYRIQGRDDDGAARLLHEARELAEAGASMLVVELIPSTLGQQLTESLPIPVIGIGAGPGCSGQVLVLHDMLGVTRGKLPRFVRNFMAGADSIESAVRAYVAAVKDGSFPDPAVHGY